MVRFITTNAKKPNVEDMMQRINNYINSNSEEALMDDALGLEEKMEAYYEKLQEVNDVYEINAQKPVVVFGKFTGLKKLIKKVLRKCMAWYVQDLADQQNVFNAAATRTLNDNYALVEELLNENKRLRKSIDRLKVANKGTNPFNDEWYVAFENIYRGSEEEILKRNQRYLPLFTGMTNVIDLGCGRGEFIDLLKKNGILARGVDLNHLMLEEARKKGLVVEQKDCIEFLKEQADGTVDGIFAGQLVEHLNLNELVELIKTSFAKLMVNGVLVMETVNPMTLGVFCYGFYIDATHSVPVHPASLSFIAGQAGFTVESINYAEEFPEEYRFSITEDMGEGTREAFEKLNKQLYGPQDYYIVCRKR